MKSFFVHPIHSQLKSALLIALTSTLLTTTARAGGTGLSGGGTGYKGGLLDLALYNQAAFNDKTPGSKLPKSKAFNRFGIERLNVDSVSSFKAAVNQVEKWLPSSPLLAPQLIAALDLLPIYYTNGKMSSSPEAYSLPYGSEIKSEELYMLGYSLEQFGNFTGQQTFESLSHVNQSAYFVHEAGRYLKIEGFSEMTDDDLQKLTALIMTEPREGQTLDRHEFLKGPILNRINKGLDLIADANKYFFETCRDSQLFCNRAQVQITQLDGNLFEILHQAHDELLPLLSAAKTQAELSKLLDISSRALSLSGRYNIMSIEGLTDRAKASSYRIKRTLYFGSLDWALEEYNTKFFSSMESSELLIKVSNGLKEIGFKD